MKTLALLALLSLGALACSGAPVVPAGASDASKPPGCPLEFLYNTPERPFEALGHRQNQVRLVPRGGAVETLRSWACALGADAVIVERNQVINWADHVMVEGTAIAWTRAPPPSVTDPAQAPALPTEPPPPPPPPAPKAAS